MKDYTADLHIHSVLSPCADLLMTPQNIIDRALEVGLDVIAITDHNSAENIEVALELAKDTHVTVLAGMEVESIEEIHLLCLFDNLEQVIKWQKIVYSSLPSLVNNEEFFGPQLLTDINDNYVAKVDRLLLTATNLSVNQIVEKVRSLGGIVIPAHIDKLNYSIIRNLGFIPTELNFTGLEIANKKNFLKMIDKIKANHNYTFVINSDAHYLKDIKKSMRVYVEEINIQELDKALIGEGGRKIEIL